MRHNIIPCCMALLIFAVFDSSTHADSIYAVQSRASTPNFQLFLELSSDGSVPFSGPLFSPAGGVFGLSFLADTLYGVELDNVTQDDYLVTIPHEGFFVGQGARIGPIGFENVESLAAVNGQLYGTSLSFPDHMTTLITVDPATGGGTSIGSGDFNVMIVGLAHDPVADVLYGAGMPFGATVNTPNLYTLDRTTGATTLIGDLGAGIQSLAWDTGLGLIGAKDHVYQIDTGTGAATQLGTSDFTDGIPDQFNGLYSLATLSMTVSVPCDLNGDTLCLITDLDLLYGQNGLADGDIDEWLTQAANVDALGRQFKPGDVDLNGAVAFPDFLALAMNFGITNNATWGKGNFDADGAVDFGDFLDLTSNFGFVSTQAAAVPEPTFPALFWVVVVGLGSRRSTNP